MTIDSRPTAPTAASSAVITEAVHLVEDTGPLEDAAAMREAFVRQPDAASRIADRAHSLGQRIGLQAEFERARHLAPLVGFALALLIVVAGLALAGSVVGGSERRINIMAALLSLLGVHAVTLVAWLAGLAWSMWPTGSAGVGRSAHIPRASLGWLWMTLTARVAGGRHGQAPVLLRAATRLLARARLLPWAFGIASHGIWTLSFVVVLLAMVYALAFHRYTLSWETTILDPQFFVRAVAWLGHVPAWFGFAVPDAAAVLGQGAGAPDPVAAARAQRAWALWLTGCIAVYGLLPRVLLLIACTAVWKARKGRLAPDLAEPYYRRLIARFDAMAPRTIVDADGGAKRPGAVRSPTSGLGDALVVAAFELAPGHIWPPAGLPASATVLDIDGSAPSRRELLDTVARLRPRALLLACRAASSPDRGTERLLRELLSHCGECRLWLVADDDAAPGDRWHRWLGDTGLTQVAAHDDLPAALAGWRA